MRIEFNKIGGKIGIAAGIVLALIALAMYLYSERAVPPESDPTIPPADEPAQESEPPGSVANQRRRDRQALDQQTSDPLQPAESGPAENAEPDPSERTEPEILLELEEKRLREDLSLRLGPGQIEMIAPERLLERLVATVNSLDGDPVPLRFRPLAHVPGLPRLEPDGQGWRLPAVSDPRYAPYRALFDRLEAVELAELFDRYEPALEQAWQALGEHSEQNFRSRLIEVLEHLAEFDLPRDRPRLHQPEVLYEYIDPSLEQLSWGRKILVRIGPDQAPAVQRKLAAIAERLASRSRQVQDGKIR